MKIDLNTYSTSKFIVLRWYEKNKDTDLVRGISHLATMTFCPSIVVAYWLGEASNWDSKVVGTIIRLQKFYDYDTILNKPEGAKEIGL